MFSIKTCSKLNSKKKIEKKEKRRMDLLLRGKTLNMRERGQKVQVIGGG